MTNLDDETLEKIVATAKKERARNARRAKYPELKKYGDSIEKLLNNDVPLPIILKWLVEEHGEKLAPNTLRKFVVRNFGRERYEQYLNRNGWQKTKRSKGGDKSKAATESKNGLGFELNLPTPREFKRTERK